MRQGNIFPNHLTFRPTHIIINVRQKGGALMSPKIGRPKIENPKTERLYIRVTPEEKAQIYDFVQKSGYTLLELLEKGIESVKK